MADNIEATGAQDVDSILSEYEKGTTQQPDLSSLTAKVDKVVNHFEAEQNARYQQDIDNSVSFIKEAGELKTSDKVVRSFLEYQASQDPDLQKAFERRYVDPAGWKKAQQNVAENLKAELGINVDDKATQDTNDLVAAMSSSQKTDKQPEQEPDFATMTDEQFQRYQNGER